jgi:LEA14-like dessication related protein
LSPGLVHKEYQPRNPQKAPNAVKRRIGNFFTGTLPVLFHSVFETQKNCSGCKNMPQSRYFIMMIRIKPGFSFFVCLLMLSCKGTPAPAPPVFLEPVFSISSITILQADLINTRLKVQVRVDNPNVFPIALSSFEYKLYGGGRFWADGKETQVLTIPAAGSGEKDLYLIMNFTNMHRDVLDQIIAMKKVQYRFTGTAIIKTDIEQLPVYTKDFNLEGESDVER